MLRYPVWNLRVDRLNSSIAPARGDKFVNLHEVSPLFIFCNAMFTYNDLSVRVSRSYRIQDGSVGVQHGLRLALSDVDIVGSEHELHDIRLGVLYPPDDIVSCDIVGLVSGVTFVVLVEARWSATGEVAH